MEQVLAEKAFEVFAWGHGYVGSRPTMAAAQRLAVEYEGARILTYEDGDFRVVARLGRYAQTRQDSADN